MSTEGTPDPVSQPSDPVGESGTPPPDTSPPASRAPGQPDPGSSYPPPAQPGPGPSYPPPGYYPPPPAQPYGEAGPAGPGYTQPGYQQPGYQPQYGPPQPLSPSDERMWATFAHIGPILTSILAPLLIWLILRERSRFVDDQGKEALNFQIFLLVAYAVGVATAWFFVGFLIIAAAWIVGLVFCIQGAIVAGRGELYRYPLTWRVIK